MPNRLVQNPLSSEEQASIDHAKKLEKESAANETSTENNAGETETGTEQPASEPAPAKEKKAKTKRVKQEGSKDKKEKRDKQSKERSKTKEKKSKDGKEESRSKGGKSSATKKLIKNLGKSTEASKPEATIKKPHRWRPGTVALRQIRKYQKSADLLLPKLSFQRVVREITQERREDTRFTRTALEALQESAEALLVNMFSYSNDTVCHAKRVTLLDKDIRFAVRHSFQDLIPSEWK